MTCQIVLVIFTERRFAAVMATILREDGPPGGQVPAALGTTPRYLRLGGGRAGIFVPSPAGYRKPPDITASGTGGSNP